MGERVGHWVGERRGGAGDQDKEQKEELSDSTEGRIMISGWRHES